MIAFEQLLPMLLFTDQKIIVILFAVLLPPFLKYLSDKVKCRYLVKYKISLSTMRTGPLGKFLIDNNIPAMLLISDRNDELLVSWQENQDIDFKWENKHFKLHVVAPTKQNGVGIISLQGINVAEIKKLIAYCDIKYPSTPRDMNGKLYRYNWNNDQYRWFATTIDNCPTFENIFVDKIKIDKIRDLIESLYIPSIAALPNSVKILLYGKPGTGKTSIANAIANHYNRPIYIADTKHLKITDIITIPRNAVIQFNDIDRFEVFCKKEILSDNKPSGEIETTDLMNFLDQASNGWIIVFTTNHINKLDPTIIRSCRIDLEMEIDLPSWEVVNQMFMTQFKKTFRDIDPGDDVCPITTADILAKVLTKKASYETAVAKMSEYL